MMKTCEQVIQEIWAYLDGQLNEDDIKHMREHIDLCRACFSRIEFEQTLRVSMQSKTNHCCPDKLKLRIKRIFDEF